MIEYVQLECDSYLVEELMGLLEPVASCASAWHNVGDDGAGVGSLFMVFFPIWLRMVVCCVGCVCFYSGFVVWWCLLRSVMYQCYFFLYNIAVLLL
jgi:hypothetical protein